jgi:hypothetical protein
MFDLPAIAGVFMLLVAAMFVAVPSMLVRSMLVDRRRRRDWLPGTAVVRRVRTETRGSSDTRRTVLVGSYDYRDPMGAPRQGEGDLGDQGLAVDGSEQTIDILIDPLDHGRSQVLKRTGNGSLGCALVVGLVVAGVGVVLAVVAVTVLAA